MRKRVVHGFALVASVAAFPTQATAQDRLRTMPGFEQFQSMSSEIAMSVKSGALSVAWKDARNFEYLVDGQYYRYDIGAKQPGPIEPPHDTPNGNRSRFTSVDRGRQLNAALSPDGKQKAFYRDRNLYIGTPEGEVTVPVTTDGNESNRIKNGTASWVYGEELAQNTAFWWSPDGNKLAYYRFDESKVPDHYLTVDETRTQNSVEVEAYPKPGVPNPVVDVYIYDLATKKSVRLDVRDGKSFDNNVVGHYVYRIAWTPDGREITIHRTNRRQNVLDFAACNPDTGNCRTILREEWPTGWVNNRPTIHYMADGNRFIWLSERTGWKNFYLYDLSGKLITPLTQHEFEVADLVRVDEANGLLYYTARDGDNYMKLQLHRVGLDGKGDVRLTDPAYNHTVSLSPDGRYFVDVAQTHDHPPFTSLIDSSGTVIAELARSDLSKFAKLGLRQPEMFTYLAADGKTVLHGLMTFPSNFDSSRRYPVLVPVYGGPSSSSNTARETWSPPASLAEYGFIIVNLDSRAAPGMGKRVMDGIYQKLGQAEIDDMSEGVKALWNRPYIDRQRVGIFGTSYGGYTALMEILRHPDVFAAAASSSPPTDWRNYDAVYTERYMSLPSDNKSGYDASSAMTYVDRLKGRLMLYYGTADNNVHPSNMMQLISALQQAGKSFDLQVGPDRGHSGINTDRMMEFFIQNLVITPAPTL